MFFVLAIVVSLVVIGSSMLIYAACTAPEGVESDRGFYLVKPQPSKSLSPSPQILLSATDAGFFRR